MVTELSRTRSEVNTLVVPLLAMAPKAGWRMSLLSLDRRHVRFVVDVWAVTSNRSERIVLTPTGQTWLTVRIVSSIHPPAGRGAGFEMLKEQLPAGPAAGPHVTGVGEGLAVGEGSGDGLGEGVGEGVGVGPGVGVGVDVGVGVGVGDEPCTTTWTVAVADEVPARAVRVYLVVVRGWSCREPLPDTSPTPWSMSIVSAPSTSQLRVVVEPGVTSSGAATKRWIARLLGCPKFSRYSQPAETAATSVAARNQATGVRRQRGISAIPQEIH